MALPFFKWSRTAASNATADPTVNWAEGMAPSAVNDSARAMMASAAAYRDDTSGKLVTTGSSTAYTLTSYQVFDSLANMDFHELSFFVHATNGANPTLNVDGLGAKALVLDGSATPVPTGTLIAGSCYNAVYVNSANAWRLKDFYQLPFTVPVGGMIEFIAGTSPNSNFVFPYGQAISRTTYSVLFGLVSTTYGAGDGSTTFNIPDLRGRVVAGDDDMGGSAASRLTGLTMSPNGTTLGATGGAQLHTLQTSELPSHTHSNSLNDPGHTHSGNTFVSQSNLSLAAGGNSVPTIVNTGGISSATTGISITNAAAGGGGAHNNMQPTIILNKLLRII